MTQVDAYERRAAPVHPALVAFGAALLIGAFATDVLYWRTLLFQWNNFSAWLLMAGLVVAGVSGIVFVVDLALGRVGPIAWWRLLGLTVAALLSLLNAFVHSRDAYTAVVPMGILLSAVVTIILVVVGVGGWNLGSRPPRRRIEPRFWDTRS